MEYTAYRLFRARAARSLLECESHVRKRRKRAFEKIAKKLYLS